MIKPINSYNRIQVSFIAFLYMSYQRIEQIGNKKTRLLTLWILILKVNFNTHPQLKNKEVKTITT